MCVVNSCWFKYAYLLIAELIGTYLINKALYYLIGKALTHIYRILLLISHSVWLYLCIAKYQAEPCAATKDI